MKTEMVLDTRTLPVSVFHPVVLTRAGAAEIAAMLLEAHDLIARIPEQMRGQLGVRHYFCDELQGGRLLITDALTASNEKDTSTESVS